MAIASNRTAHSFTGTTTIDIDAGDVIFAAANSAGAGSDATTCTCDGVAMTVAGYVNIGTNDYVWLFYLLNPNVGASKTITATGGTSDALGVGTYSGASQSTIDGSPVTNYENGSSTQTLTYSTAIDNDWLIAVQTNEVGSVTGGSAYKRESYGLLFDSNGAVAHGSPTLTWTFNTGTPKSGVVGIAIRPYVASSGPANLKSLDTNIKSNIKSYNTNVLANIKSINSNI